MSQLFNDSQPIIKLVDDLLRILVSGNADDAIPWKRIYWLYCLVLTVSGNCCRGFWNYLHEIIPRLQQILAFLIFVFYGISFSASIFAFKIIDMSIAYAVWMALATATIAVIGLVWFHEPFLPLKVVALVRP